MSKTKIGLVELYNHSEVLLTFYRLLQNDFEVTVFTTQKIKKESEDFFSKKLNNWISKPEDEIKERFVNIHFSKFEEQDVLIFITLIDEYRFFSKIKFKAKTILIIHNVNTLLQPEKNVLLDNSSTKNYATDALRYLRNSFRRDNFYKRKLLQNFDHLAFPSDNLTTYAKSLKTDFSEKIIDATPFSFFEKINTELENDSIVISVPGVVLERVRNYEILFEAFVEVVPRLKKKIRLQFLGNASRPFAQGLEMRFRELENDFFEVNFFQHHISQKKYDAYLFNTDFAIIPIRRFKKFGIIQEEYGISNITGGVNDMLRFGIPFLISKSYPPEKSWKDLAVFFENKNELIKVIEKWIAEFVFEKIKMESSRTLENYNENACKQSIISQIVEIKM